MKIPEQAFADSGDLWRFPFDKLKPEHSGDTYRCSLPNGLELSCTLTREGEITRRTDTLRNTANHPIRCEDFAMCFPFDGGEYQVYSQFSCPQNESVGEWQPLVTSVQAACRNARTSVDATPMLALWDACTGAGTVFHLLPRSTWFLQATRVRLKSNLHRVEVTAGFAGSVTVEPGETIALPEILFYDFRNKTDLDCWKLHRWFHDRFPAKPMPVLYNSWMFRFDGFSPEDILRQIAPAAELGAEYFVIDAGWFGEKGRWSKTVGDWQECGNSATEGRLSEIAGQVRKSGMQFGLWLEPERAAQNSRMAAEHPEYYCLRDGRYQLNFACPAAVSHMLRVVDDLIDRYGVAYFKFDDNGDLLARPEDRQHLDYFRGYYAFLHAIREKHPSLLIEGCASGGMRMNLTAAIEYENLWITDNQSHYYGMDIYKNTLLRMPPQVLERWAVFYEEKNSAPSSVPPFSYSPILCCDDAVWSHVESADASWVEGFLTGSVPGFSCDLTKILPETRERLKKLVSEFRENREFWREAECRILADTKQILSLQYNDRDFSQIHLLTYIRRPGQAAVTVIPCLPGGEYRPQRLEISKSYSCIHTRLK